ncbi:MAG: hypothetical protein U5L45_14725 [Saprospiraceae bacterium]|nr:hypothetical protein [Saprospiraceae bacterium]
MLFVRAKRAIDLVTDVTQSRRLDRFCSGGFHSAENVHTFSLRAAGSTHMYMHRAYGS